MVALGGYAVAYSWTHGQANWDLQFDQLLVQLDTDLPAIQNQVTGTGATSSTNITVPAASGALGPIAINEAGRNFPVGALAQLQVPGTNTLIEGAVVSYIGGNLTINATAWNGAGTFNKWLVTLITATQNLKGAFERTFAGGSFSTLGGDVNAVDTTGGVLIATLPANPQKGDSPIDFEDAQMKWGTNALTIARAELLTNTTFTVDTSGWTALNSAALSIVGGMLQVTNTIAAAGGGSQAVPTVPGTTYDVSIAFDRDGSAATAVLNVGTTAGGTDLLTTSSAAATGTLSGSFVATTATTYVEAALPATNGVHAKYDNPTVKPRINGIASDFTCGTSFACPVTMRARFVGGVTGWGVKFS